jgi:cellulose synthase/poly-beta-1,6-N-acetylglucosamine synthase-like glycosyltransferase
MTDPSLTDLAMLAASGSLGVSLLFWSAIGLLRLAGETLGGRAAAPARALSVKDVAVVIPAHNEEVALPKCLRAILRIIPAEQVHVASDGSKDRTVEIARAAGCRVLDIQPNGGKARALDAAIRHFGLCETYRVVLIQDADSEIDPHYLERGLPLFDDEAVAVVAGHVLSRWRLDRRFGLDLVYTAYRTRLYRVLQAVFQYGMSWKPASVSYIAPGFASMYRTSALAQIDITAPGLVIEDFNMTFEVQRKKLGRIAYTPAARCTSEDPFSLRDYCKQVQRWYLGFWQTVLRHGVWPSLFWLSLGFLLVELVVVAGFLVVLPVALAASLAAGSPGLAFSPLDLSFHEISPLAALLLFLAVDYCVTIIVAIVDRRPVLLAYGLAFPALRLLDAALFLRALVLSFTAKSDGRWKSPERYTAPPAETLASNLEVAA